MISAGQWPEADRLFRSDPSWLGSDDAYSIPLDNERTLWLFGDTFVGSSRAEARFLRNSIAIQSGSDPSSANIRFYNSFFETEESWLWPLHGALIDSSLLLFFMKVKPARLPSRGPIEDWRELGNLGFFDVYDWEAVRVENPNDDPEAWRWTTLAERPNTAGIIPGAAVSVSDEIYAYGWKGRQGYLARWSDSPQWFSNGTWTTDASKATVVLPDAATEFTVHFDERLGKWCHIQLNGSISLRTAEKPEGPWSEPTTIFVPEEQDRPGVMVYAAKAHPQLTGADLVLTYASIGPGADETIRDDTVYYPRFVRVSF